jgi:GNAT superfamily N-acetyltransferase
LNARYRVKGTIIGHRASNVVVTILFFAAGKSGVKKCNRAPAFQGLGKHLIAEVCNYCRANGFGAAYVEAESDDKAAVEFYRKTKYSSLTKAIHFTYDF